MLNLFNLFVVAFVYNLISGFFFSSFKPKEDQEQGLTKAGACEAAGWGPTFESAHHGSY